MDWQFGAICALFLYSVAITTLHVRRSRRFAYRASQFKRRRHVSTTVAKNDDEISKAHDAAVIEQTLAAADKVFSTL